MENRDIFLTIIGIVAIVSLAGFFYILISNPIKFKIRLAKSMKFFIAFVVFMILAGLDFSNPLNVSFVIIAITCGIGCLFNAIMYND